MNIYEMMPCACHCADPYHKHNVPTGNKAMVNWMTYEKTRKFLGPLGWCFEKGAQWVGCNPGGNSFLDAVSICITMSPELPRGSNGGSNKLRADVVHSKYFGRPGGKGDE